MNEYSNELVTRKAEPESFGNFLDAYESLSGESIEVVEEAEVAEAISFALALTE